MGLLNGTVTVKELQEYEIPICSLSNGFESQFKCVYIVVNASGNSVEKLCLIEAFYRRAYLTVILISVFDFIQQNIWEKPHKIHCYTYILFYQLSNFMESVFTHVNGISRFYPFSNVVVVVALVTVNNTGKNSDLVGFSRSYFEYIAINSPIKLRWLRCWRVIHFLLNRKNQIRNVKVVGQSRLKSLTRTN